MRSFIAIALVALLAGCWESDATVKTKIVYVDRVVEKIVEVPTQIDLGGCFCGCADGKLCKCATKTKAACGCTAPCPCKPAPGGVGTCQSYLCPANGGLPQPPVVRPLKTGPCSALCTCGCKAGAVCRCNARPQAAPLPQFPSFLPAPVSGCPNGQCPNVRR